MLLLQRGKMAQRIAQQGSKTKVGRRRRRRWEEDDGVPVVLLCCATSRSSSRTMCVAISSTTTVSNVELSLCVVANDSRTCNGHVYEVDMSSSLSSSSACRLDTSVTICRVQQCIDGV